MRWFETSPRRAISRGQYPHLLHDTASSGLTYPVRVHLPRSWHTAAHFFRNAFSISSSRLRRSSSLSLARSSTGSCPDCLPCSLSCRRTHERSVSGFTSSSRATWAMGLLDFNASWTASSRNSGEYELERATFCFPRFPLQDNPIGSLSGNFGAPQPSRRWPGRSGRSTRGVRSSVGGAATACARRWRARRRSARRTAACALPPRPPVHQAGHPFWVRLSLRDGDQRGFRVRVVW
jgi:hypothetical protein